MKSSLFISTLLLFCISVFVSAEDPEILINKQLADRLSLRPGDSVKISSAGDLKNARIFRVTAIFEEKADPTTVPLKRSVVKMHLGDLEKLTGKEDLLDLISISAAAGTDTHKLAARLNADAIGFTAHSAQQLAVQSSKTFQVVNRFHQAIAFITMVAGAVFIFALMVMRVEDQRKNFAIASVIGVSRSTMLQTLLLESVLFAFFASLLGAAIGYVTTILVNLYYQNFYNTTLTFAAVTPEILLQAILISFGLGMIAGTFSWFRLKRLVPLRELGR